MKSARFVVANYVELIAVAVMLVAPCLLHAQQTPISPDGYGQLKYRYIGPEGNRATAVAGVPGKPNIWYVGAASGGRLLGGGTSSALSTARIRICVVVKGPGSYWVKLFIVGW